MKYTVKSGDTLGGIAKTFYNDAMKYKDIAEANNIANPDIISVGQELILPGLEDSTMEDPVVSDNDSSVADISGEMFTADALKKIMPNAKTENIHKYLDALNSEMAKFEINSPLRSAHFIAQLAHESACFNYSSENLNYSAKALKSVFGKYFPTDELAEEYARKPEKIANRVYANRMNNGDEGSGDGWKYRGRGLIQLTGKENYTKCGEALQIDLLGNPDQLADDASAAVAAAGWYWETRKLNADADNDDIKAITKKINGGYNGLEDREEYLTRAKQVLNI